MLLCNPPFICQHKIVENECGCCSQIKKSRQNCYSRWLTTDVFIIDEVSQLGRRAFDHINFIAQKVRGIETKPFGGIQVIAIGDFKQLSPLSKGEMKVSIVL